jgi:uncharacterized protein (TIGR02001 family)
MVAKFGLWALLAIFPLAVHADVSSNLAVTNDYVFRGITNSLHGAALQGGLDYSGAKGLYAGTWLSNVDFNDGNQARYEVDIYVGQTGSYHSLNWDVSVVTFSYPGAARSLKYDSHKYRLDLRHPLGDATVGGYYDYIHDYFGSGGAHYLEALAIIPAGDYNIDLRFGKQVLSDNTVLGLSDYLLHAISLQRSFGDWDTRLTWQSTGLSAAECFSGQNWCKPVVSLVLTRYLSLTEGR